MAIITITVSYKQFLVTFLNTKQHYNKISYLTSDLSLQNISGIEVNAEQHHRSF
jgi:hypothetical protein